MAALFDAAVVVVAVVVVAFICVACAYLGLYLREQIKGDE